jgi:hypothetical protein
MSPALLLRPEPVFGARDMATKSEEPEPTISLVSHLQPSLMMLQSLEVYHVKYPKPQGLP